MASKKMDKLAKQATESPWAERLRKMRRYQEENSKTWRRNEKLIFGRSMESTGDDINPPKKNVIAYGWGLVKSLETQIYVQNPDMLVEAYDSAMREKARVVTSVATYDLDQMDVKTLGSMALLDCFPYGYGALVETVKTDKYEDGGVAEQGYMMRRVHPRDILFDPQGLLGDLSDHRYVACAFYPTIGELLDDSVFKANMPSEDDLKTFPECSQLTRQTKSSDGYSMKGGAYLGDEKDLSYRTICVWEIHDAVADEIIYITDYRNLEIGRIESPLRLRIGPRKLFPITMLSLNPATTGFYPIPEMDLVSNQLILLNEIEGMIYQDTATKWRKIVALGNFIGPDQTAATTDPNTADSVIRISVDDLRELTTDQHMHELDVSKLFSVLEDISAKRDLPLVKEMVEQDIAKVLGYGPIDRGGLPKTRSAREAMAIKEKMEMRLVKRSDAITDFYRLIGSKHVQILQQTLEIRRYAKIEPDVGMLAEWVQYGAQELDIGEFDFVVYAGSAGPQSTESKRASELQLFQTLAPIIQAMGGDLRPAFYRLARYFNWDAVDELFKSPKEAAKQLAVVLAQMQTQQVPPTALIEAAAASVNASLNSDEINQIKAMLAGKGPIPGPRGIVKGERGDQAPLKTTMGEM